MGHSNRYVFMTFISRCVATKIIKSNSYFLEKTNIDFIKTISNLLTFYYVVQGDLDSYKVCF